MRMATLEDTAAAVKSMQDTALVCSGLNRCSLADTGEVTVELSRPTDKYPRYTVTVADSPKVKDTANMKFAAFIVPQGRLVVPHGPLVTFKHKFLVLQKVRKLIHLYLCQHNILNRTE